MSSAFEIIEGCNDRYLVMSDHASNYIPPELNNLGLPTKETNRHIAWDPGAKAVSLLLAKALECPAVLSHFSRLLIDPNRSEDDPTLIRRIYDGTIIPGNHHLDALGREERLNKFYRPYHNAVKAQIAQQLTSGIPPILLSIHSFTPYLRDGVKRPWHIGVLWDKDDRISAPMLDMLGQNPDICVGDNMPYSGRLEGDCMFMHGTSRNIPHVLIELRNDLIATAEGQRKWADVILNTLSKITL